MKLYYAIKFTWNGQVKQFGDIAFIKEALVLLVLVDALQDVVIVVELLEPFEEEVLADFALLFSHELFSHW